MTCGGHDEHIDVTVGQKLTVIRAIELVHSEAVLP